MGFTPGLLNAKTIHIDGAPEMSGSVLLNSFDWAQRILTMVLTVTRSLFARTWYRQPSELSNEEKKDVFWTFEHLLYPHRTSFLPNISSLNRRNLRSFLLKGLMPRAVISHFNPLYCEQTNNISDCLCSDLPEKTHQRILSSHLSH